MNKQKVVIYGSKNRKLYKFFYKDRYDYNSLFKFPEVQSYTELIEEVKVWEGEIDNPPLELEEKLYISDLETTVEITDKARNSDGGYVYWTDYVTETIEDGRTAETKDKAESRQVEYLTFMERRHKSEKVVVQEKKKWYQFWK